ncbi:MAG: ABC transporter substrate-binding protein [bacterium]
MSKTSKNILWTIIILALIGGLFAWHARLKQPKELEHVTVGIQTSPAMALVMVAKDKGFFEKEGLNVELKEFTAGKFALEAFLGGSLDFSISGDVPVTLASLQGNKFVVPAQVVGKTQNEVRVVARKEAGLETSDQYFKAKKRKIATSIGGGPEFFTYEFLNKLGISKDQVEIVSQAPKDMPAALISGSVDAIAVFDPFAYIAEKQLGDKSITFTDASIYSELYVIEAKESVKENPATLEKLLKGLVEAEKFTKNNPEEAKAVVMKYTKLDKETVDGIWGSFDFRIALTPQLLEYLNREAQWAKDSGKVTKDTVIPNFQDVIYSAPLKKISSGAVGI